MPCFYCFRAVLFIGLFTTIPNCLLFAQLEQLAIRVPDTANALVVINAKAVFDSPLAHSQQWRQEGLKSHKAGITALPAGAEEVLLAAQMDFEMMHPIWEIAVAYVDQRPNMKDIATRSGGRTDRLAGVRAVERPNDSFVVALGPKVVGAMSPANRQHVIRWVRESQRRKTPELSDFLSKSLQIADRAENHIVLALDLQDIFAVNEVAAKLNQKAAILENVSVEIQDLAQLIASIQGIRLEVSLSDPPQGRLILNFGEDAASLDQIAKPILMQVLDKHGANLEDIKSWQAETEGSTVILEGQLSESGLRRVLSVLSSPVGPMASTQENPGSTSEAVADASQRYFQSVIHYLDDLFASDYRPQSMYQARTWIERYSRKIGDLDTYQVDTDVLSYAGNVMDYLNEIVTVIDRTQQRSDLREVFLYEPGRRRYNRYGAFGGYVEKPYVGRDRALIQGEELQQGLQQVDAIVRDLRTISADTRKKMTERYGRQF